MKWVEHLEIAREQGEREGMFIGAMVTAVIMTGGFLGLHAMSKPKSKKRRKSKQFRHFY